MGNSSLLRLVVARAIRPRGWRVLRALCLFFICRALFARVVCGALFARLSLSHERKKAKWGREAGKHSALRAL